MLINNSNNNFFDDLSNYDFKGFSQFLASLSPLEFSTIGSVLGILLSIPLTSSELNSLGNFLELVGQVMLTYQAQLELITPSYPENEEFQRLKADIDKKYNELLAILKKYKV